MTAKTSTAPTRRRSRSTSKSRKPNVIEIEGHLLTPELYREYERHLESRRQTNRDDTPQRIAYLALDELLAKFRFSSRAGKLLPALYGELSSVALAVASLDRYPFYASRARHVRLAGCDTLNRLAAEAQHLGAKIHAIGEAIRYEDREKLQDWIRRQEALDSASPHGQSPTVKS